MKNWIKRNWGLTLWVSFLAAMAIGELTAHAQKPDPPMQIVPAPQQHPTVLSCQAEAKDKIYDEYFAMSMELIALGDARVNRIVKKHALRSKALAEQGLKCAEQGNK